jgi:hypothetical protein
MNRIEKKLVDDGLYVRPVYLTEACLEIGYFVVAVDDPYEVAKIQGQDQG